MKWKSTLFHFRAEELTQGLAPFISDVERVKWKSTLFHFRCPRANIRVIIPRSSAVAQSPEFALGLIPFIIPLFCKKTDKIFKENKGAVPKVVRQIAIEKLDN